MKKKFFIIFLILPFVCLVLGSCGKSSPFGDKISRAILSLGDERKSNELMMMAHEVDEEGKILIARSFAAIQDSASVPLLTNWLLEGKDANLRITAVFALGQFRKSFVLSIIDQAYQKEKSLLVREELVKAAGKCGGEAWLVKNCVKPDDRLAESFARAFGYISVSTLSLKTLILLAEKGNEETEYGALSALATFKGSLQEFQSIFSKIAGDSGHELKDGPLAQCLAKSGPEGIAAIEALYKDHSDILAKINILKALKYTSGTAAAPLLQKALKDPSALVREAALDRIRQFPEVLSLPEYLTAIRTEPFPLIQFGLTGVLIEQSGSIRADSLSNWIVKRAESEKDPYIIGYQCQALAGSWKNIAFLEDLMFSTPDILVREFAFEAILKIRSDRRFSAFSQAWKQANPSARPLRDHIAAIIHSAFETMDVSLLAIAAVMMRDTTLPEPGSKGIPIPYSSTAFLESALVKLKLPRDIETYGEILKTIRFYQGKPVSGTLKPEFNNPIDWDLVLRIPEGQKVLMETDSGNIELELWPSKAPGTCAQFVRLINEGFYNQKRVHRVVPGFVMQDGCPRGDGYGSLMETIRSEFHESAEFLPGTLGMASAGMDTESCQWFITHAATPHLNGRYTAFGRVSAGMENVFKITRGTLIRSVRLLD